MSNSASMVRYCDGLIVYRCADGDAHIIFVADVFEGCGESDFDFVVSGDVAFPSGILGGAFVGGFGDCCADAGYGGDQEGCL